MHEGRVTRGRGLLEPYLAKQRAATAKVTRTNQEAINRHLIDFRLILPTKYLRTTGVEVTKSHHSLGDKL